MLMALRLSLFALFGLWGLSIVMFKLASGKGVTFPLFAWQVELSNFCVGVAVASLFAVYILSEMELWARRRPTERDVWQDEF